MHFENPHTLAPPTPTPAPNSTPHFPNYTCPPLTATSHRGRQDLTSTWRQESRSSPNMSPNGCVCPMRDHPCTRPVLAQPPSPRQHLPLAKERDLTLPTFQPTSAHNNTSDSRTHVRTLTTAITGLSPSPRRHCPSLSPRYTLATTTASPRTSRPVDQCQR